MAYNAGDKINRELRLRGHLAEGEKTSAPTSQDDLVAM